MTWGEESARVGQGHPVDRDKNIVYNHDYQESSTLQSGCSSTSCRILYTCDPRLPRKQGRAGTTTAKMFDVCRASSSRCTRTSANTTRIYVHTSTNTPQTHSLRDVSELGPRSFRCLQRGLLSQQRHTDERLEGADYLPTHPDEDDASTCPPIPIKPAKHMKLRRVLTEKQRQSRDVAVDREAGAMARKQRRKRRRGGSE
eukprot:GHVU01021929.1.p1 GENE.GHVU01021929.1~~GHVU01021929.1.p1  ORF type:complete len:200 (-),score=17.51 GHVU01021929.1:635-1234(-)